MASFVLMQPPADETSAGPVLPQFVRDGFSWPGLVFGPFWLAWRRLWLPAILVLAAMIVLNAGGSTLGLTLPATLLSALVSLWVGFEGSAMRLAALRRKGYTETGVVTADSLTDAEQRFAAGIAEHGSAVRRATSTGLRLSISKPLPHDPAIGSLTYPGQG